MLGVAQTGPIKSLSLTVSVLDRIQLGVESLAVLEYTVSWGEGSLHLGWPVFLTEQAWNHELDWFHSALCGQPRRNWTLQRENVTLSGVHPWGPAGSWLCAQGPRPQASSTQHLLRDREPQGCYSASFGKILLRKKSGVCVCFGYRLL